MNKLIYQIQLDDLLKTENEIVRIMAISAKGILTFQSLTYNDGMLLVRRAEDFEHIYITENFLLENGWWNSDGLLVYENKAIKITVGQPSECTWIVTIVTSKLKIRKPITYVDELQRMIRTADDIEFANNLRI